MVYIYIYIYQDVFDITILTSNDLSDVIMMYVFVLVKKKSENHIHLLYIQYIYTCIYVCKIVSI